jgi:dienelactone hydrolase
VTSFDLGSDGSLGERGVTVFYPADATKTTGHPRFTYKLTDPLPHALTTIVPAKFNSTIAVDAYVDAPGSSAGPFPIVLFSHGFGASRLYYSHLLAGMASWGFVIVSADYLERGLISQAIHSTVQDTPAIDLATMFSSLTVVELASNSASSPLHGTADPHKVAAVGHSAGGQTAFDALDDPRVDTAVGWAPVGPSGAFSRKPVMIIGEEHDVALTPATLTNEYHQFRGSTTFIELSGDGHNSYTDICPPIRNGGGGLVGFAISLHVISGELAKLATNGCTKQDPPAQRFWPVIQAYTVAALRHGLGLAHTEDLTASSHASFLGFPVEIQQHG